MSGRDEDPPEGGPTDPLTADQEARADAVDAVGAVLDAVREAIEREHGAQ